MKTIVLIICLVALAVAALADDTDVEDLGLFTPRRGITLDKIDAAAFKEFRVEFIPQNPPTNVVAITTTNELLTVEDVPMLPSGPTIMGVRTIAIDGGESPVQLYRFNLRRAGPPAPRARTTFLPSSEPERSTTNAVRRVIERRKAEAPEPPMPPAMKAALPGPIPPADKWPKPMPGARNQTYAESQDAAAISMERHYAKPGRRNE